MKKYIYMRVSSDEQDFAQQKHCIYDYFARNGIDAATISGVIVEKHTGTDSYTNRKFAKLLETAQSGDIIYISELSRIGRNMSDIFRAVSVACDKGKEEAEETGRKTDQTPPYGIIIQECKGGGMHIENNTIGGKAVLYALSLAAELEVLNIRQRTRMALSAIRAKHKRGEVHISKTGRECTHLGRERGCDTAFARQQSEKIRKANSEAWRANSPGYKAVRRWVCGGMSDEWILCEFNNFNKAHPHDYCTRRGLPLSLPVLRKWRAEINKEFSQKQA